jgi:hypothetical protein
VSRRNYFCIALLLVTWSRPVFAQLSKCTQLIYAKEGADAPTITSGMQRSSFDGKPYELPWSRARIAEGRVVVLVGQGHYAFAEWSSDALADVLTIEESQSNARVAVRTHSVFRLRRLSALRPQEGTAGGTPYFLAQADREGESLEFLPSQQGACPLFFVPGAVVTLLGSVDIREHQMTSAEADPLTLRLTGTAPFYEHVRGVGTVTVSGRTVRYPRK